jgi:phage tail-like protein
MQHYRRYLQIFEEIWETFEQRQNNIAFYFDSRTCPTSFLGMFESWFGVTFSAEWPDSCRRHLLSKAGHLFAERGTHKALEDAIAIYTGVSPTITNEWTTLTVVVDLRLPRGCKRKIAGTNAEFEIEQSAIEAIILALKPAHVAYRLIWRNEP